MGGGNLHILRRRILRIVEIDSIGLFRVIFENFENNEKARIWGIHSALCGTEVGWVKKLLRRKKLELKPRSLCLWKAKLFLDKKWVKKGQNYPRWSEKIRNLAEHLSEGFGFLRTFLEMFQFDVFSGPCSQTRISAIFPNFVFFGVFWRFLMFFYVFI